MKAVKISQLLEAGFGPVGAGMAPSTDSLHSRLFGPQAGGASLGVVSAWLGAPTSFQANVREGVPRPIDLPASVEGRTRNGETVRKQCMIRIINGPHLKRDGNLLNIFIEVDVENAERLARDSELFPSSASPDLILVIQCGDTVIGSKKLQSGSSGLISIQVSELAKETWLRKYPEDEATLEFPIAFLTFHLRIEP